MKNTTHYIVMSGDHGCLPDYCGVCSTHRDAVEDLRQMFELSRRKTTELRQTDSLELGPNDGAEYCEIVECNCDTPAVHSDDLPTDPDEFFQSQDLQVAQYAREHKDREA